MADAHSPILLSPAGDDPPAVVTEAEAYLRRKRWQWGLSLGALTLALPTLAVTGVLLFPISWWVGAGALTGASVLYAPGTRTRWAKRVLHRWEALQLDEALPAPTREKDPRLRAAEAIAERIRAHPTVDAEAGRAVEELLERVRAAVHDLQAVALLEEGGVPQADVDRTRAAAEVQLARWLSGLDELHHAVIAQEDARARPVQVEVQAVVARLAAARDVERLLAPEPESPPAA